MLPDLTNAIVKITSRAPENAAFGTGFVIYRDDAGDYLLTCKHVVNAVGQETLLADGRAAQEIVSGDAQGLDLAVLRVAPSLARERLALKPSRTPCAEFCTRGYYSFATETISEDGYTKNAAISLSDTLTGQLETVSKTAIHHAGQEVAAWWLTLPQTDLSLQPGYSGAPLLETASGAVIGVISIRQNAGQRGLAISVSALDLIWPHHPPDLFETPKRPPWPEPIINLDTERAAFSAIVAGHDTQTRLLLVHGESGMGKTHLVEMYEQIAEAEQRQTILVDFKKQVPVEDCLAKIVAALGGIDVFPKYDDVCVRFPTNNDEKRWRVLTDHFFADFKRSDAASQVFLLFDTYDHDKPDASFKRWLTDMLLPHLAYQNKLVVVIAGQEAVSPPKELKRCHQHFPLTGVAVEKYQDYAKACEITLPLEHIQLLHEAFHGKPSEFVYFIKGRRDNAAKHPPEAQYA